MKKINFINDLKFNEDNIYNIDKSHSINNNKVDTKKSYFKASNMILPKYFEDNSSNKWLNELSSRYCNLYKNAHLIIAFMADYLPDSFKDEVYERTGFRPSKKYLYCPDITLKNYRGLTVLEILEDYMLGYDTQNSSDLEKIIASIKKNPDINIDYVLRHFNQDESNIGFSKFDEAMKILIDLVYSFVKAQKSFGVKEASKTTHGYQIQGKEKIPDYVLDCKLDALERYYSILEFRNSYEDSSYRFERGMKSLNFSTGFYDRKVLFRFSLVGKNKFINALAITRYSLGEVIHIKPQFKEEIYFKFHDEIPRYHNAICNSIHGVNGGCNTEFFPKEEDIFYLDKKFIALCPCCGSRVSTGVLSRNHKSKIEARIKKRCMDDKDLDRKVSILSELISIGGTDYNKGKVKVKK